MAKWVPWRGRRRRKSELRPEALLQYYADGHDDSPPSAGPCARVSQAFKKLRRGPSQKLSEKWPKSLFSSSRKEPKALLAAPIELLLTALERRTKLTDAHCSMRALRNVKPTMLKTALATLDNEHLVGLLKALSLLLETIAATSIQGRFRGNISRKATMNNKAMLRARSKSKLYVVIAPDPPTHTRASAPAHAARPKPHARTHAAPLPYGDSARSSSAASSSARSTWT